MIMNELELSNTVGIPSEKKDIDQFEMSLITTTNTITLLMPIITQLPVVSTCVIYLFYSAANES